MGGLARRVSYIKAFKERFKDVPTLAVDSGYFLASDQTSHGSIRFDAVVKDEWTLRAYEQSSVDVANISAHDMRYLSTLMTKQEFARRANSLPILKRLVSANITADPQDNIAPPGFIILDVPAKGNAKPFKAAFIGLSETHASPPAGFQIADPIEAAKRAVAEARRSADLIVVLAHLSTAESVRLAREVQGIDAIVSGNAQANEQLFTLPVRTGQTYILFTPYETRTLGELRFYRDGEGRFTSRARFISLDGGIPDDPETLKIVDAARIADEEARKAARTLLDEWLASSRRLTAGVNAAPGNGATGATAPVPSAACAQCHGEQYGKWSATRHARATDSLVIKQVEFEARCLSCHASGTIRNEAKELSALPQLQNIHCEACHGPGSEHIKKPAKGYGVIADLKANCTVCHTPQTSPGFDPQAAWEKIKH